MLRCFTNVIIFAIWLKVVTGQLQCGDHQYSDNGSCFDCEKCGAGLQPNDLCYRGNIGSNYGCKACPDNSFSDKLGYELCRTCKPCARWNSETVSTCTSTQDAVCGKCFPGYYRPQLSDGSVDKECHLCTDASADNAECQVHNKQNSLNILYIVVGLLCALVLCIVAGIIIYCVCMKQREKSDNHHLTTDGKPVVNPSSIEERERLAVYNDKECTHSITSDEIRKRGQYVDSSLQSDVIMEMETSLRRDSNLVSASAPPYSQMNSLMPYSQVNPVPHPMFIASEGYQQATALPRNYPRFYGSDQDGIVQPVTPANESGNYSNMSTAEFHTHGSMSTYSNLPTSQYEEHSMNNSTTGNATRFNGSNHGSAPAHNLHSNSPQSYSSANDSRTDSSEQSHSSYSAVRRGGSFGSNRRRRQAETSSSESLLRNIDRDSKIVGRESPLSTVSRSNVEFFDTTDAIDNEITKAKKLYKSTSATPDRVWRKPQSVRSQSPASIHSGRGVRSLESALISRPRPNAPLISPCGSRTIIMPPPELKSSIHTAQACPGSSVPEITFHDKQHYLEDFRDKCRRAQEKVKDVPLQNLDPELTKQIVSRYGSGQSRRDEGSWVRVGEFFELDCAHNTFYSISDILQCLLRNYGAKYTVANLMQAFEQVGREDVLTIMSDYILNTPTSSQDSTPIPLFGRHCVTVQA